MNAIHLSHLPYLILKLYIFIRVIPLTPGKMIHGIVSKGRGKNNEFEYSFLIICRDLNFVKKSEDNLIVVKH